MMKRRAPLPPTFRRAIWCHDPSYNDNSIIQQQQQQPATAPPAPTLFTSVTPIYYERPIETPPIVTSAIVRVNGSNTTGYGAYGEQMQMQQQSHNEEEQPPPSYSELNFETAPSMAGMLGANAREKNNTRHNDERGENDENPLSGHSMLNDVGMGSSSSSTTDHNDEERRTERPKIGVNQTMLRTRITVPPLPNTVVVKQEPNILLLVTLIIVLIMVILLLVLLIRS